MLLWAIQKLSRLRDARIDIEKTLRFSRRDPYTREPLNHRLRVDAYAETPSKKIALEVFAETPSIPKIAGRYYALQLIADEIIFVVPDRRGAERVREAVETVYPRRADSKVWVAFEEEEVWVRQAP